MEEDNLLRLGELFRELRLARGLKLKDVARSNLSVSQLSKFENGQTMLAADKMLVAIAGIHMSLAEFGHALNQYKEDEFHQLAEKIQHLQSQQDLAGLEALLDEKNEPEENEVYYKLQQLVIKSGIFSLDPTYEITQQEKKILTEYLFGIEEWTAYELYVFGNALNILSDEDLIFLGKAFVERNKFYLSLPHYKTNAEVVILNISLTLIYREQYYHASYFMEKLEGLISYQDMFHTVVLNYMRKLLAYLTDQSVTIDDIKVYIKLVEDIGSPTVASLLRVSLEQILSK